MRTWQNSDGLYGGTIATWWSSTLETAASHPMNQFPVIQGFLKLHRAGTDGGGWLDEARRIGNGLIASVQPNGLLKNAWGDIPGKGSGPVLHAPGITALCDLFKETGDAEYLGGAFHLHDLVKRKWTNGRHLYHRVANQQCKWGEALLAMFGVTGNKEYLIQARDVFREAIEHQIAVGRLSGAFHQGRVDDRLITVYSAKCLRPLLSLYRITREPYALERARMLGRFLLQAELDGGIWINYAFPNYRYQVLQRLLKGLDRRLRYVLPMHRLRRALIPGYSFISYPSFIARSGDGIAGLMELSEFDPQFSGVGQRLLSKMVQRQMAHGGIRNSVGYSGYARRLNLQDVLSPMRWNAYAFYALCQIVADQGCAVEIPSRMVNLEVSLGEQDRIRLVERTDELEVYTDGQLVASIEKPTGKAIFLSPEWGGDLSGPRNVGNNDR